MTTNLALGMRANSTIMNLQKILGTLSAGVRRAEGSGIGLLTLSRSHCRQWPTEEKFVSADPPWRGIIPKYHVLINHVAPAAIRVRLPGSRLAEPRAVDV